MQRAESQRDDLFKQKRIWIVKWGMSLTNYISKRSMKWEEQPALNTNLVNQRYLHNKSERPAFTSHLLSFAEYLVRENEEKTHTKH